MGLTLRKAKVEEKLTIGHYLVRDIIDNSTIVMSISGKLRMENFELENGEIVYAIVSLYNRTKGRLAIEGHRGGLEEYKREKELLDENKDSLEE